MILIIVDENKKHAFEIETKNEKVIRAREISSINFDKEGWFIKTYGNAGRMIKTFDMVMLGDLIFND